MNFLVLGMIFLHKGAVSGQVPTGDVLFSVDCGEFVWPSDPPKPGENDRLPDGNLEYGFAFSEPSFLQLADFPYVDTLCFEGFEDFEVNLSSPFFFEMLEGKNNCRRLVESFGPSPLPGNRFGFVLLGLIEVSIGFMPDPNRPYLRFWLATENVTDLQLVLETPSSYFNTEHIRQSFPLSLSGFSSLPECEGTKWRRINLSLVPILEVFRLAQEQEPGTVSCDNCTNLYDCPGCLDTTLPLSIFLEINSSLDSPWVFGVDGFEFVSPPLPNSSLYPTRNIKLAEEISIDAFQLSEDTGGILFLVVAGLFLAVLGAVLTFTDRSLVKINILANGWLVVSLMLTIFAFTQLRSFENEFNSFQDATNEVADALPEALSRLISSDFDKIAGAQPFGSSLVSLPPYSRQQLNEIFRFEDPEGPNLLNPCDLELKSGIKATCVSEGEFFRTFHDSLVLFTSSAPVIVTEQAPLMYRTEVRINLDRLLLFIRLSLIGDIIVTSLQLCFVVLARRFPEKNRRGSFFLVLDWIAVAISTALVIAVSVLVLVNPILYDVDGALIRIGPEQFNANSQVYHALNRTIAVDALPKRIRIDSEGRLSFNLLDDSAKLCLFEDFNTSIIDAASPYTTAVIFSVLADSLEFSENGLISKECSSPLSFSSDAECLNEQCERINLVSAESVQPIQEFVFERVFLSVVLFDIIITAFDIAIASIATYYRPKFFNNHDSTSIKVAS